MALQIFVAMLSVFNAVNICGLLSLILLSLDFSVTDVKSKHTLHKVVLSAAFYLPAFFLCASFYLPAFFLLTMGGFVHRIGAVSSALEGFS